MNPASWQARFESKTVSWETPAEGEPFTLEQCEEKARSLAERFSAYVGSRLFIEHLCDSYARIDVFSDDGFEDSLLAAFRTEVHRVRPKPRNPRLDAANGLYRQFQARQQPIPNSAPESSQEEDR
jgi:hypothetical protein